ncbi:type IV secretory system conjugative DNA transfer family protein [Pseudonocardia sediminis]|uniref:type IV secretory system conjugative DNA transfer family protein n=1 Tax=Pseudonocardia sediminis TaxID=1397368 RepID=UPI001A91CDAC|nr:TraM recognition domain-containing protein [Pseudonocardia sediminis]
MTTAVVAWSQYRSWLTALVGLAVAGLAAAVLRRWLRRQPHPRWDQFRDFLRPQAHSAQTVLDRSETTLRQHGLASDAEIREHGGEAAVLALAPIVRPSLAHRSDVKVEEVALELCTVGKRKVWSSIEQVVLYFAGPRRGKTGYLNCRVVDYPGSVVTTSTRIDVFTATHRARAARGRVQVFNAGGFPGVDEVAVTFNPLTGCEEAETATQRAEDMIPESTGEEERWQSLARGALSSLMHAAALDGRDMDTVQRWVAAPGEHQDEVIRILRRSTSGGVMEDARQFFECNDKTRSSITTSVMPALRWLQSKTARLAAGLDGAQARPLDSASLLTSVSTLYVLGRRAGHTYPLMSALTGYVARAAREQAAGMPSGRCDPPLGLLLDEAGDLRPPLPDWTRDMGGSGITIAACFQSYAQMVGAWGKEGAAIILNNAGPIMLGGGTKDPDDLAVWRDLAGDRDDRTTTTDAQGKVTAAAMRSVPVLPASQLASQARMEVVLFHGEMRPALGRTTPLWERDPSVASPPPPSVEEVESPVVEVPRVWRRSSPPRSRRVPVEEVVADV